jgi:hypothetical protein
LRQKKKDRRLVPCDAFRPVKGLIICSGLSYAQRVEQRSANRSVHRQAISAFKSRNGTAGLRSNNSVDYAAIVTELAKAPLHSCNH